MELDGKTAVITGGASGIGLATAKQFAAAHVNLVLGDIEEATLQSVVEELRGDGAHVIGLRTDVSVEDDVIALRDAALAEYGAAHVVFNNAGVAAGGAAIGTPTAIWNWLLSVNLDGVIHGLNAFVPLFLEQNEGHVVNTASLAGLGGAPGMGSYCASKFAVVGLSESLFQELLLSGKDVGVSVLCPGFVKTRIHESERNMPNELVSYNEDPVARLIAEMATTAVNAGIDAADVAAAVENAVRTNKFWIFPHERSAIRTTELRLEWMRGGPPMRFDLMGATKP
ncbi:MAG TPA: SDR family NAD(P)-dependent oxidoreductase [Acidimicrobiales bacterium]|jgi:NAD(P)-dependent dehydrogenase (short-subunit alcohol dehydrogenase family)|nr:SDR family NAD(P)-dependent oxidoreductase [Acidimicrobiales bacterium]